MSDDTETHTEHLFTTEANLRIAARAFASNSTNESRKALREAALLYAAASDEVDEAVEALRAAVSP